MPRFYIRTSQTSVHPDDPGFETKKEARKELREDVDEDLKYAKRCGWKRATKIKLSDDAYAIHASPDRQSPLWREHFITSF